MAADDRFWNRIAEDYAQKPVDDPEAFERKIALTLGRMAPDHVVADFGCGTGSLVLRLAPSAQHVHGLDISHAMVRIARGKAAAADAPNVTFHLGELNDDVPFEPASLDGVCAYSLLHLVDDPRRALDQLFGLLKPGGFFVSSTVCLGETWVPYRPMLAVGRWFGKAPMVKILRKQQLREDMAGAGFVDVEEPDVGAASTTAFILCTKPL